MQCNAATAPSVYLLNVSSAMVPFPSLPSSHPLPLLQFGLPAYFAVLCVKLRRLQHLSALLFRPIKPSLSPLRPPRQSVWMPWTHYSWRNANLFMRQRGACKL